MSNIYRNRLGGSARRRGAGRRRQRLRRHHERLSEKGEVLLRGVGTLRYIFPPNASVQWQPDGLAIRAQKWFLGARFLGAPHIYIYIYLCVYVCVCMCIYIYIYVYVCVYIYIYIYVYVCIYIYIYIHDILSGFGVATAGHGSPTVFS